MRVGAVAFREAGLAWRKTRIDGLSWFPLWQEEGPPAQGRARAGASLLIRMEPGVGYATHRHIGTEDVLVLQGGYEDELGAYRAGEFVHYAAGSTHAPRALAEPAAGGGPPQACILFAVVPLGIELLDRPAPDGRAAE
jgi:anti-sigma factor ChrR (cupin superfamily)